MVQTQDAQAPKPKAKRASPMALLDKTRNEKLIELAHARFDPELADAELMILRDSATSIAPPTPEESDPRPEVRPEFIRWLVTDQEASVFIDPKGVIIQSVTVPATLDLQRCRLPHPISLLQCDFRGEVDIRSADLPGLYLWRCSLAKGLTANWANVRGSISLVEVQSAGTIGLALARIEGEFGCSDTKFTGDEPCIDAVAAEVRGGIRLTPGFECNGEVNLNRAHLGRMLDCSGARFRCSDVALRAHLIRVDGDVYLRNTECSGAILLAGAQIEDFLDCAGAKLTKKGDALVAHEVVVGAAVVLRELESSGKLDLSGARINSYLSCDGAKLKVASGGTLSAYHAAIGGGVTLSEGFESTGTICLDSANIKGSLNCSGAKLAAKDGEALSADLAAIRGSVFFTGGFESLQSIRMVDARVEGSLICVGAKPSRLLLSGMKISGDLLWLGVQISEATQLVLFGAKVKNLRDDLGSWPKEGGLILDGLEYEELTLHKKPTPRQIEASSLPQELPFIPKERVRWIKLQPKIRRLEPQPWVQLSELLEAKGDHAGAKHVIAAFRRVKAQELEWHPLRWLSEKAAGLLTPRTAIRLSRSVLHDLRHPNRALAVVFALLEEAPARILYSIAFSVVVGGLIFSHARAAGALAPTEPQAYEAFTHGKPMPAAYPTLHPFIYALENAVPLVKLGQDDKWAPDPHHGAADWATNYSFLMWVRWGLILFGWFQATVLAAALVSRFKP